MQSKACVEYVGELLDAPDAKHLVFAHHTVMMDAIETLLRKCAPSLQAHNFLRKCLRRTHDHNAHILPLQSLVKWYRIMHRQCCQVHALRASFCLISTMRLEVASACRDTLSHKWHPLPTTPIPAKCASRHLILNLCEQSFEYCVGDQRLDYSLHDANGMLDGKVNGQSWL